MAAARLKPSRLSAHGIATPNVSASPAPIAVSPILSTKETSNSFLLLTPLTISTISPDPAAVMYQRLVRVATMAEMAATVKIAIAMSVGPRR